MSNICTQYAVVIQFDFIVTRLVGLVLFFSWYLIQFEQNTDQPHDDQ